MDIKVEHLSFKDKSVLALNEAPFNPPTNLIEQFASCVEGKLNDASLGFLHSVNKENPSELAKLVNKLRNIGLQLSADMIHRIMQLFVDQLKIPHDAVQSLQAFLSDPEKQARLQALQTEIAEGAQHHLSIQHIFDSLAIFTENNVAEQFLRTILIVLSDPHRSHKETIKWIKTSLDIPYKSGIAQMVHVMAAHLQLSDSLIMGKTRNMDGLELLLLFKHLTLHTKMILVTKTNKQWIQHLHAAILSLAIYKNSPHAFYDLVLFHAKHPDFSSHSSLLTTRSAPLTIDGFIHSTTFKKYFPQQRYHKHNLNQYVFLSTLEYYLHKVIQDVVQTHDPHHAKIVEFLQKCTVQCKTMDTTSFIQWYQNVPPFKGLESHLASTLLQAIHSLAMEHKVQQSGRMRANAMQLITLGFSHRSEASLASGVFQPCVNMDIAAMHLDNIRNFTQFIEQQTATVRLNILHEILLGYLLSHHRVPVMISQADPATLSGLTTFHPPKSTATVPQVFRANPLNQHRMFTPKPNETAMLTRDQDKTHGPH